MVTPAEACEILGISNVTLKRWRHSNRLIKGIHYTQYGPKTIRYDATWLEKFRRSGGRGHHKMELADEIMTSTLAHHKSIDLLGMSNKLFLGHLGQVRRDRPSLVCMN